VYEYTISKIAEISEFSFENWILRKSIQKLKIMSNKINVGMEVHDFRNGILTENIPFSNFKGNLLISGGARAERRALLSHVLNQFHTDFPDLGVLLIQLESGEDRNLFYLDRVYEYGDPELIIPYFTGEQFTDVNTDHFTRYINAVFGFHLFYVVIIGVGDSPVQ
jgi:hypothetical protein